MNEQSDPFLMVLDAYKQAVFTKDIDAFLALYDGDVHVFDMWDSWSLHGINTWREMAVSWFSSLGDERVVVDFKESSTTHIGELAIGYATLTYTAISSDDKKLRSLSNRITMALRRTGESWKVFHEHTSAPIDHQSTKAILHATNERSGSSEQTLRVS